MALARKKPRMYLSFLSLKTIHVRLAPLVVIPDIAPGRGSGDTLSVQFKTFLLQFTLDRELRLRSPQCFCEDVRKV